MPSPSPPPFSNLQNDVGGDAVGDELVEAAADIQQAGRALLFQNLGRRDLDEELPVCQLDGRAGLQKGVAAGGGEG